MGAREIGAALERSAKQEMLSDTSAPGPDAVTAICRQSMFWTPERQAPSAWTEHVPFAFWLIDVLRPATIVELGTHAGVSYSAMCQAVKALGLPARCFAIDTWKGDEHAGFYSEEVYRDFAAFHDPRYGAFSRLVRSTFDEALPHFEDGSIDLLHIDGLQVYEAVRHDFFSWLPKLTPNAIVILHGINVRERRSGVFQLWQEISVGKPHFAFLHGHGLGVLALGRDYPRPLRCLFDAACEGSLASSIRAVFAHLGRAAAFLGERAELNALRDEKVRLLGDVERMRAESDAALTRERRAAAWRDSLLRAELLEADRDRRRLQSALNHLNPALADLHASQAETLPQNAQELEHVVAALYTSRSWQMTAPLRWLGNLLRGSRTPPAPLARGQRSPEELRQLIAAIYASRSWRLARPLRFISRRLGAARSRRKASRGHSKSGANDKDSRIQSKSYNESNLSGFVADFGQKPNVRGTAFFP
jgi:predicted O-methyltransferase YrrM